MAVTARCGNNEEHGAHVFYRDSEAGRVGRLCVGNIGEPIVEVPAYAAEAALLRDLEDERDHLDSAPLAQHGRGS